MTQVTTGQGLNPQDGHLLNDPQHSLAEPQFQHWQPVVDLLATAASAKSCLVLRRLPDRLEVITASANPENPVTAGTQFPLDQSLFCMRVINSRQPLRIAANEADSLSYYGMPLLSPDGSAFGSLCIMEAHPQLDHEALAGHMQHTRKLLERLLGQQQQLQTLSKEALQDPLTRLYNRRGFQRIASSQADQFFAADRSTGLLFIDIDSLKQINDRLGHRMGDAVIEACATILQEVLGDRALLCRYAGDEFLALITATNPVQLRAQVTRLRHALGGQHYVGQTQVSASVGFEILESRNDDALQRTMALADANMYSLKKCLSA